MKAGWICVWGWNWDSASPGPLGLTSTKRMPRAVLQKYQPVFYPEEVCDTSVRQSPCSRPPQSPYCAMCPVSLQGGPPRGSVFHPPLECPSEKRGSEGCSPDLSQGTIPEQDEEARACSSGMLIGRGITVPLGLRGQTEAQGGTETCQVSRQISDRVSPKFQQTVLSSARGPGQVDRNLLTDDFLGFHGGQGVCPHCTMRGRRNRQRHVIL